MSNVLTLFNSLLNDLFDNLLPFTAGSEAIMIATPLSDRVYEVNGTFDQQLTYKTQHTGMLNGFIQLNPAFGRLLSGSSPAVQPPGKGGKIKKEPDEKGKKGSNGSGRIEDGKVIFGKTGKGAEFDVTLCMERVRKVDSKLHRGNFCLISFLSLTGKCPNG